MQEITVLNAVREGVYELEEVGVGLETQGNT
jgi:hypothetical protein